MKTYRILVLGASGSGKTVFLASMFEKLSVQSRNTGFFLKASSLEQQKILINKYTEIVDPMRDWPPSTLRSEVSEWKFICSRHSSRSNYPVFTFIYHDYAGEILTDDMQYDIATIDINKEAERSDSILVLLDGQKILNAIQKDVSNTFIGTIHNDLRHILPIVQRVIHKPAHFVITKWDLFDGNYTLKDVYKCLLENQKFVDIVGQRTEIGNPIRLIPVSALGKGFARIDENGLMEKTPGVFPTPFQLEVPIACTVIDTLNNIKAEFSSDEMYTGKGVAKLHFFLRLLRNFAPLISILSKYIPMPPEYQLGREIIQRLLDYMAKSETKSIETLENEQRQFFDKTQGNEQAIEGLIRNCYIILMKLKRSFPESELRIR